MTNSFIYSFAPFFKSKDLYSSAASGQLFQVQRLLAKGCDPNLPHMSGLLPIHFAASRGHVELVAFLLESKQQHVDVVDKEGEVRQMGLNGSHVY
jgi:ankyrin repeat protein